MLDTFFNTFRKIVVGVVTFVFAFVIVYTPQNFVSRENVPYAEAQLGGIVSDPAHTAVSSVGYGIQGGLIIKETILDGIAWAIAKTIVSSMVSSLVEWINNGFEGEPAFIKDLDQFLLNAVDDAAGQFILEELGSDASFLCSPFKLDIQIALALEYEQIKAGQPYNYEGCNVSDMVGNIEEFISGNFEQGGWKDWITITSEPGQYTPYGQTLTAKEQLRSRLLNTQEKEKTQLEWGNGFLSGKTCKQVPQPDGKTKEECKITKPGATISEALNKRLGAGQDTLITADEISEVIGALIAQLANQAITGAAGLLGLSQGTGYTYEGFSGGSYTSAATAQGSTQSSSGQGLTVLRDSLKVQQDYQALANATVPMLQAYIANTQNSAANREVAQVYLRQAQTVQSQAPANVTSVLTLVTLYEALEAEYNNPNTSATRKTAIGQEQLELMSTFSSLTVFSKTQLEGSRASWNALP